MKTFEQMRREFAAHGVTLGEPGQDFLGNTSRCYCLWMPTGGDSEKTYGYAVNVYPDWQRSYPKLQQILDRLDRDAAKLDTLCEEFFNGSNKG